MLEAQLNMFDVIVIFVLGFSALISFFRGFLREVFSLGSWLGAGMITLYAYPSMANMLNAQINNTLISGGMASMGTFIGALIILSIFGSVMLKYLKPSSEVGIVDNTLGLAFGILRGVLLVAIGFYMMSLFMRPEDYPAWVADAKTRPHVEEIAGWVGQIAPNYLSELSPKPGDTPLEEVAEDMKVFEPQANTTLPETLPGEPNAEPTIDNAADAPFWPSMDELQQTIENEQANDR